MIAMPPLTAPRPAARKSRYTLLAGFGALLSLLGGLGLYSVRALGRLSRLEVSATSRFLDRARCIENSRRLFRDSSGAVADALLEQRSPDSRAEAQALQSWRQATGELNRCRRMEGNSPETDLLDRELSGYWTQAEEILLRGRDANETGRLKLLHDKLIPPRDHLLTLFDEIIWKDRAQLLHWAEGRAVQVRAEMNAVWIVIGITGILWLAVAIVTYTHIVKLQKSSDVQYENAVRASEELERLSERLFHVQEVERRRIASDLHDDFGQRMASLILEMGHTAADAGVPPVLRGALEAMVERLRTLSRDLQAMSRGLHSAVLDKIGLEAAIGSECDTLGRHGIEVTFEAANVPRKLPENIALTMYRVFQEAAQNALKHSGTDRLHVSLETKGDELLLRVRDYGRGFDAPAAKSGLGMISMRERLRIAGGVLSISAAPGGGALVEARVPLPSPRAKIPTPRA